MAVPTWTGRSGAAGAPVGAVSVAASRRFGRHLVGGGGIGGGGNSESGGGYGGAAAAAARVVGQSQGALA